MMVVIFFGLKMLLGERFNGLTASGRWRIEAHKLSQ